MKIEIKTIDKIEDLELLEAYSNDEFLFRGQNNCFYKENGDLSFPSSMQRHGCTPSLMLKWNHYAKAIIRAYDITIDEVSSEIAQAFLQHYGWRSFYIDLTESLAIASWFALNEFKSTKQLCMCENHEENPVYMLHNIAEYSMRSDYGHLFVISKKELENCNSQIHNLNTIKCHENFSTRFNAQKAYLANAVNGYLPPRAVVKHYKVAPSVLSKFCEARKILTVTDVFPNRKNDYFLDELLNASWKKVSDEIIPGYHRSIPLPEYDFEYTKHLSPKVALYEKFWIKDQAVDFKPGNIFSTTPTYRLPEEAFFSHIFEDCQFSNTMKILQEKRRIHIELDNPIMVPEWTDKYCYEKGISVELNDKYEICISAISVEYVGIKMHSAGTLLGWHYKRNDSGYWVKFEKEGECPCENHWRHKLHYSLLATFEHYLNDGDIIKSDSCEGIHRFI